MLNTKKFKTATIIKDHNNGGIGVKGVWGLAIDYGYSSTKVYAPNSYALFPSFAVKLDEKPQFTGTLSGKHIVYKDCTTEEYWIVGDAAQKEISQTNTTISTDDILGVNRFGSPKSKVILRVGLALGLRKNEFGDPTGREIYVQTGLPPKYRKSQSAEITNDLVGKHHFTLKIGNAPEVEYCFEIKKENVTQVIPQPVGTLFSVVTDNSHKIDFPLLSKKALIFDAGYGTLDIYTIANNKVDKVETFPEFGMCNVMKRTIKEIEKQYGVEISLVAFQNNLERGEFDVASRFASTSYPFGDILEAKSAELCDEALEQIGQMYELFNYDLFIITGGTSAAWEGYIRNKLVGLKNLKVINGNCNEPSLPFTLANVRGYYMYLYEFLKKKYASSKEA